jgi:hypothetical protein
MAGIQVIVFHLKCSNPCAHIVVHMCVCVSHIHYNYSACRNKREEERKVSRFVELATGRLSVSFSVNCELKFC